MGTKKRNVLPEEEAKYGRCIYYILGCNTLDAGTPMIDHTPSKETFSVFQLFMQANSRMRPCVNWRIFQRLARGEKCGF